MLKLIQTERLSRSITQVVMNRPDRRNALSIALLDELVAAVRMLSQDGQSRIIILSGAGPIFCAGLDLIEAADESRVERSTASLQAVLDVLRSTPLITIAAIRGGAFAGGVGLVGACDLAVAADDAKFALPEARRGLVPALVSRVLQPKLRVGDLCELYLLGQSISAVRAQQMGLIQTVVPPDELMNAALNMARTVASGGPETIRTIKRLLNSLAQTPLEDVLAELHRTARRNDEAREGLAAFREKRSPYWMDEEIP